MGLLTVLGGSHFFENRFWFLCLKWFQSLSQQYFFLSSSLFYFHLVSFQSVPNVFAVGS
jgi:hypothetical protein